MARSISVKVPTATLITQIEIRLAEIEKEIGDYPAQRKVFDEETKAYKAKVGKFLSEYLRDNYEKVGYDYGDTIRVSNMYGHHKVDFTFQVDDVTNFPERPVAPASPNPNKSYGREYVTQKSLLEKNLRILKMTTQEEVNASTYGTIMDII
jgi:hypothetical protein